jgi:hypothetical protein
MLHSGQQVEAVVGVEPTYIRFAGGALNRSGIPPRTLDWIRTSGLPLRRRTLFPLRYEGVVRVPGLEPGMPEATVLQTAGRPAAHDALGVSARGRSGTTRATTWRAQPVHHRHHDLAYPWEVSNLRPPLCRSGAPLLSYTGLPCAGSSRTRPRPAYKAGHTNQVGSGASGSDARTRTGITWLSLATVMGPGRCHDLGTTWPRW